MGGLDLETLGLSSPTTLLELPPLTLNVRLPPVKRPSKVPNRLTDVPLPPQQDRVGSGRSPQGQLIESQDFSTVGDDPVLGGTGEGEGGDGEFGDGGETFVVEDFADDDDGLGAIRVGSLGLLDNSGDGDRRSVDPRHKQPLEDGPVEF